MVVGDVKLMLIRAILLAYEHFIPIHIRVDSHLPRLSQVPAGAWSISLTFLFFTDVVWGIGSVLGVNMYNYFKSRECSLRAGTQIYSKPMLLAGALDELERLAQKRNADSKKSGRAGPGCVVDLLDLNDQSRASFELVMPTEADSKNNRISVLSPLGSSLLGLKTGSIRRVSFWGYNRRFQVLGIHYNDSITTRKEETPS